MSDLATRLGRLTPQERAALEQRLLAKAAAARKPQGIPRRAPGDPAPLSFSQRRLWYLEQLNPGTATYNAPYAFRGRGELDVVALRRAVDKIVERHIVLRTAIGTSDAGEPVTAVAEQWEAVRVVDLDLPPEQAEAEALTLADREAQQPFDLAHDLMLRVLVFRWSASDFLLLFTAHHIAWDGVSKGVFFAELQHLYSAFLNSSEAQLPLPVIDYADYAVWQQQTFAGAAREKEAEYWKQKLAGAPAYLDIPLDKPRPAVQRFRGAKIRFELPASLLSGAQALSRAERTTLYGTMVAAFKVFLLAFTGQEDISVATPFAGRDEPETQQIIGFFTNTVVLRTLLSPNLTFQQVLQRVRETLLGAQEHQRMPMDQLVELLGTPRDLTRMPLAQVNFRLQGGKPPEPSLQGTVLTPLPLIDTLISKFDMALEAPSVPGEQGYVEYNTDLFAESRMNRIPAAFEALLSALIASPAVPVGTLSAFASVKDLSPKRRRLGLAPKVSATRTEP